MTQKINYNADIAIHPGVTLKETLEALGMSQKELAQRAGLAIQTINKIVKGIDPITPETAVKLERVLGISASFWNNLDRNYQETIARLEAEKTLKEEYALAEKYTCYPQLVKWNFVPYAENIQDRTNNLLRFFGVNSLKIVPQINCIAFRKSIKKSVSKECISAWLRCGELEVQKKENKEFNQKKLLDSLDELKTLTLKRPEEYEKLVKSILEESGVNVVFTPYFKDTYINGATRWINDNPLIQLNLRFSYSDILWFTFFHELGHILLHGKKDKFIEFNFKEEFDQKEKEADTFASNKLIPEELYNEFLSKKEISSESIKTFAKDLNIHPSIVAGRLAHDGKLTWRSSNLFRQKLVFDTLGD